MAQHDKLVGLMQPMERFARAINTSNRTASSYGTQKAGSLYIPNADGTATIIGAEAGLDETGGAQGRIDFVGDTTPPSAPTGLTWTSTTGDITGSWAGTLADGIPADFAYVELRVVVDEDTVLAGRLTEAGSTSAPQLTRGTSYDCYAVAVDVQGNVSAESEHTTVECVDRIEDTVDAVDADIADVKAKADELAGELDSANQKIEQVATDVDGVKTTATNAVEKAEQSLEVATEAKQTATEIKTTADKAYEDAESALKQSSEALQTADGLSAKVTEAAETANSAYSAATSAEQTATGLKQTVEENYLTKDAAAGEYATVSRVSAIEQDASAIKLSVKEANDTADSALAAANSGITKVEVQYAQNQSSSTAPTSGWSATAPTWKDGYYIWQRTVTTYKNGNTSTSTATCISGAKGATGATGAAGKDGASYRPNLLLQGNDPNHGGGATTYPLAIWTLAEQLTSGKTYSFTFHMSANTGGCYWALFFGGGTYGACGFRAITDGATGTFSGTFTATDNIAAQKTAYLYMRDSRNGWSGNQIDCTIDWAVLVEGSIPATEYTYATSELVGATGATGAAGKDGVGYKANLIVRSMLPKDDTGYGWVNNGNVTVIENVKIDGIDTLHFSQASNTTTFVPAIAQGKAVRLEWGKTYIYAAKLKFPKRWKASGSVPLHFWTGSDANDTDAAAGTFNNRSGVSITPMQPAANTYTEANVWQQQVYKITTAAQAPDSDHLYPKLRPFVYGNVLDETGCTEGWVRDMLLMEGYADTVPEWTLSAQELVGTGVSAITPQYYLSSSNTTQTDGSWVTTCPAWLTGYYIWTRSKCDWTDGTTTYTTPVLDNALNGLGQRVVTVEQTAEAVETKVATLEGDVETQATLIRQSGNGVEVARKVDGAYTSTKTLMGADGFHVQDAAGNDLSVFGENTVELGKGNSAATISMCDDAFLFRTRSSGGVTWSDMIAVNESATDAKPASISVAAQKGVNTTTPYTSAINNYANNTSAYSQMSASWGDYGTSIKTVIENQVPYVKWRANGNSGLYETQLNADVYAKYHAAQWVVQSQTWSDTYLWGWRYGQVITCVVSHNNGSYTNLGPQTAKTSVGYINSDCKPKSWVVACAGVINGYVITAEVNPSTGQVCVFNSSGSDIGSSEISFRASMTWCV